MEPKYTDEQMALILKRAAELQAAGEEPVHTLAAIQQIAVQVGIEPSIVASAAASLTADDMQRSPAMFGAPSVFRVARRIPGVIAAAQYPEVLAAIRDCMPRVGAVSTQAGQLEWFSGAADMKTSISVSTAGGETVLRAEGRHDGGKALAYLAAGTVTLVTGVLGAAIAPLVGVGAGVGMLAVSFATARTLWNRAAQRNRRRAAAALDAIGALVAPAPPHPGNDGTP